VKTNISQSFGEIWCFLWALEVVGKSLLKYCDWKTWECWLAWKTRK